MRVFIVDSAQTLCSIFVSSQSAREPTTREEVGGAVGAKAVEWPLMEVLLSDLPLSPLEASRKQLRSAVAH